MKFYTYDLETMLNCFLFTGKFFGSAEVYVFEISDRVNQRNELLQHLHFLHANGCILVGYNNLGFDYPIIHQFLQHPYTFEALTAYNMAQTIINTQRYGQGGNHIRFNDRMIPQLDLMKLNHFDNPNKRTRLKDLQFAMRSESVEDLPFDFATKLTPAQMDTMISYNRHDVTETEKFLIKCMPMIQMRQELVNNGVLSGDVLNYSDVKLGTEYLVRKIGRNKCFIQGSQPRQTVRREIVFRDVILPKVSFRTEQFQSVLDWFNSQTVYIDSSTRPRLETLLGGLQFHFGVGGVHASVENKYYETTATHVIKDVDVAGMYPAVAIANQFAPEHLGADFVSAYRQLSEDRKHHAKGSVMNLILKLAGNGASGNFENPYSCLYDVKCAYQVRINGQLSIVQLAELLSLIGGVELIQANTDGITALVPKAVEPFFDMWCNEWECLTGLKLEHATYRRMWISDVNSYIAEGMDGKHKLKGRYWWPRSDSDYQGSSGSNWNKDFSNLTAQKGAFAMLVHGIQPETAVRLLNDPFDFMLRYKVPAGAKVYIGDEEQQRTVRYYVSTAGKPMKKIATPKGEIGAFKRRNSIPDELYQTVLASIAPGAWDERIHTKNKSKYAAVVTSVESGRQVKNCNKASDFNWADVDWDYYTQEIEKLRIQ